MEMKKGLHIRDAREGEREVIWEVTLAAYEEYAAVVPAAFWNAYRQVLLTTLDEKKPVERIVAESNGAIVGSVLLYPSLANAYTGATESASWPEVRILAVAPLARGQGVGNALMDECERRARNAGATALGLHTMDMMQAAMRMYEQRGFVRTPDSDFRPAEGVLVKGYRLSLDGRTGDNS